MRRLWLAISCALLLGACGKNTFKSAATCETEAKATSEWLSVLVAEGDGGLHFRPDDFEAVTSDAPPSWSKGWPHVALSVGVGTVDGTPVWQPGRDMKQLVHSVTSRRALREKLSGEKAPFWVSLELDRRVRWSTAVELLDALAGAGVAGIQLVFEAKSQLEAPPASPRSEQLHRVHVLGDDVADRTLDPAVEDSVLHGCRAVPQLDRSVPRHETLKRWAAAVAECECALDVREVREAFWLALRRDHAPPRSFVPVRLEPPGSEAPAFVLPAETSWGDAHAKVVSRDRSELPLRAALPVAVATD
jgi:hypothetical protein